MSGTASRLFRLSLLAMLFLSLSFQAGIVSAQANDEAVETCWPDEEADDSAGYQQWENPPELVIDEDEEYAATIETDAGNIELDLFADEAPLAVNNFVCLALAGFYDDTSFHRVVPGFVIQGGDPTGNGDGDPGYEFRDELVERDYEEGTLAMANAGPDTNGSQFFIVLDDRAGESLPPDYTIFGEVSDGLDVVQEIGGEEVEPGSGDGIEVDTITVDGPIAAQTDVEKTAAALVIGQLLISTEGAILLPDLVVNLGKERELEVGTKLVVLEQPVGEVGDGDYVLVKERESGDTGYVALTTVEITDEADPTTLGATIVLTIGTELYSAPDIGSVLIDELDAGTELVVIGEVIEDSVVLWLLVREPETGNVGYVDGWETRVAGFDRADYVG